jgi:hypothetical protein
MLKEQADFIIHTIYFKKQEVCPKNQSAVKP